MSRNRGRLAIIGLAALGVVIALLVTFLAGDSSNPHNPTFAQYASGQLFVTAWYVAMPYIEAVLIVGAIVAVITSFLRGVLWSKDWFLHAAGMWLAINLSGALTSIIGLMSGLFLSSLGAELAVQLFGISGGWGPFSLIWIAQISGLIVGMAATGTVVGITLAAAYWRLSRKQSPGLSLEWLARTVAIRSQLAFLICLLAANILAWVLRPGTLAENVLQLGGACIGARLGYRTMVVADEAE